MPLSGSDFQYLILSWLDLIISIVPSVEPPSIMISSLLGYVCPDTLSMQRCNVLAPLYTATITEIEVFEVILFIKELVYSFSTTEDTESTELCHFSLCPLCSLWFLFVAGFFYWYYRDFLIFPGIRNWCIVFQPQRSQRPSCVSADRAHLRRFAESVSYTHLTLP